jgi:glycosyltransferase involved in cell wall biosynthesis
MKKNEKVCITWCHTHTVSNEFAVSLADIIRSRGSRIGSFHCVEGTGLLSKSRNISIKHFLDYSKCDWLLMLDADERISIEAFDKLVDAADAEKRPLMAGLYFAALWIDGNLRPTPLIFKNENEKGVLPYDNYEENSIIPIAAAGTGFLLIHRSVFEKMREALTNENCGPDWCWFQDGPINGNRWLSEDLSFFARIHNLGIPVYAHTGAIADHHKPMWLNEKQYKVWAAHNEPGTGLEQLM